MAGFLHNDQPRGGPENAPPTLIKVTEVINQLSLLAPSAVSL